MEFDDYGDVINDDVTYEEIAHRLGIGETVIIGWTDQRNTHLDILFCFKPEVIGFLQGGMMRANLFVAIMRIGAFGFAVTPRADTHASYITKKYGISGVTAQALADLIDNIRRRLR